MGRRKIQNEHEVLKWFAEGKTYQWMIDEYIRKYDIETTTAMWCNFRSRRGVARRIVWDVELIPWSVTLEHKASYPYKMLRNEARRRAGFEVKEALRGPLEAWKSKLVRRDLVIHYDPDTDRGFIEVPRREGIDTDLIRVPDAVARREPLPE